MTKYSDNLALADVEAVSFTAADGGDRDGRVIQ